MSCPDSCGHGSCFAKWQSESAYKDAVPAQPVEPGAAAKIRGRIDDLELQHVNYLAYQQDRVRERDHHGAWDVAINLSEVECELAGLEFALKALEEERGA